jgi:hypothetical protein
VQVLRDRHTGEALDHLEHRHQPHRPANWHRPRPHGRALAVDAGLTPSDIDGIATLGDTPIALAARRSASSRR